jgi:hypothetical protein
VERVRDGIPGLRQLTVIWRATVHDGLPTLWQIIDDTPGQRALLKLTDL